MAKFSGEIAYAISTETSPGVWTDVITKRKYLGDIIKDSRRWTPDQKLNENMLVSNRISIIADSFAHANFSMMKWINFGGTNWTISNVDVQRPRLILTLGSVYNGPTT